MECDFYDVQNEHKFNHTFIYMKKKMKHTVESAAEETLLSFASLNGKSLRNQKMDRNATKARPKL